MSTQETPRIVAVTGCLSLGGSTTFLVNFLRALRGRADLRIVCPDATNDHASDFASLSADIQNQDVSSLIYEDRLEWVYRRLADFEPTAILACLGSESFEMLRLAPPGVARIGLIQSHDPGPYELAGKYAPWLDAMVGVSPEITRHLQAMPEFQSTRVVAIPYGIDFQAPVSRPARVAGEPIRVLYLGRLVEVQKKVSRLVALALRFRQDEKSPVEFTFAGFGPKEAEMREALHSLPYVNFRGMVPNSDVPALLRLHDVYILLSDFEGLPLSLLEAMGEGVVPLVSDLPNGMGEVVAGAGVTVPVGEVDAAESALRGLAQDPARLRALSAEAQAKARTEYSATRMVAQHLALVAEIRGHQPPPQYLERPKIPAPLGVQPWLFSGWPRKMRRALKKRGLSHSRGR